MISLPIILASTFGALSGCLCLTLLSCIPLIRKGFRQYRMERQATIPSSISVYEDKGKPNPRFIVGCIIFVLSWLSSIQAVYSSQYLVGS